MGAFLTLVFDIFLFVFKALRPGGRCRILAEHLLVKQQLLAVSQKRERAPNLTSFDRVVLGLDR